MTRTSSFAKIGKVINQAAYESAGTGRRAGSWYAPGSGSNAALLSSLSNLRNRSRAAMRNNPWIGKGINNLVINEVGTGIYPKSKTSNESLRKAINELWDISVSEFDPEGVLNFYGMQSQIVRARRTSGEVFIRKRMRPLGFYSVPVQFQVLESDFVPHDKTETLRNGNKIVGGIEFNKKGARVAYWMYTDHPSDTLSFNNNLIRVPSKNVIHHFCPTRPGQVRGEPDSSRALLKAHTFDSYDDAELVRKQTRAPFTGFLQKSDIYSDEEYKYDPFTGESLKTDSDNIPQLDAQPGSILQGLYGEELKLFDGDNTGSGYADFMKQQLLAIAAGIDIPYELLTGDWSKVNDRLVRAILNEFHRQIEATQDHLTVFQVCRGIRNLWIDAAVMSGVLVLPGYADKKADYQKTEWRPQAWNYVNPVQDVEAKLNAIDGGLTSRDAEVAKTGWDAEEIDKQNIEGEKRIKELREEAGLTDEVE